MTLYRSVGENLMPDPPRSRIEIEFDLQQGALLQRHPWTRVAWRRSDGGKTTGKSALAKPALAKFYVAGQTHALPIADARTLAAAEILDGETYAALSADSQSLVLDLLAEGHYRLDNEDFGTGEDDDDA